MRKTQNRGARSHVAQLCAVSVFCLAGGLMSLPAPAAADDGSDDSVIDIIIDWIEDLLGIDPTEDEELPSDGDSW